MKTRSFRFAVAVFGLFLVWGLRPSAAQEARQRSSERSTPRVGYDPASFDITAEQAANPPERKITFEQKSDEYGLPLQNPDPELLKRKYVARIRIVVPGESPPMGVRKTDVASLQFIGYEYLLYPGHRGWGVPSHPSDSLQAMLAQVPEDRRPQPEALRFLEERPEYVLTQGQGTASRDPFGGGIRLYREIRVLGDTPEQAEQYAAAVLTILDQGMSRPIQLELFKQREEQLAIVQEKQKELDELDAQVAQLKKEAEEVADFGGELLPGLRVQQLQLEVDAAGIKSRIEACERLLAAKDELPEERRAQVFDKKIAAEIDLASLEARRKTLAGFIEKVKRSQTLHGELKSVQDKRRSEVNRLQGLLSMIRNLDNAIRAYQPVKLEDDRVIIQPIKWTS